MASVPIVLPHSSRARRAPRLVTLKVKEPAMRNAVIKVTDAKMLVPGCRVRLAPWCKALALDS